MYFNCHGNTSSDSAVAAYRESSRAERGQTGMPAATTGEHMSKAGKGGSENGILPFTVYPDRAGRHWTIRRTSPRVCKPAQIRPRIRPNHGDTRLRTVKFKPSAGSSLRVGSPTQKAVSEVQGKDRRERLSLAGCRGAGSHIAACVRWEPRAATGYRQITQGSLFPAVADWNPAVPGHETRPNMTSTSASIVAASL